MHVCSSFSCHTGTEFHILRTGSGELWVAAGTCESRFLLTEVLAICGVNGGSSATVLICCGLSVVPDAAMSLSGETSS